MLNLVDDTTNQSSKFRTKNCVETNDESWGAYNASGQIKFKTSIIRSIICDYSDACIHVKGTAIITNMADTDAAANNDKKKVIFKNCVPFTHCISEINNTEVDDPNDIDVLISM